MAALFSIDREWNESVDAAEIASFREQDVELLLDEAADLLDRILEDKSEFDLLGEKHFDSQAFEAEKVRLESEVSLGLPSSVLPPYSPETKKLKVQDLQGFALGEEYYSSYGQLAHFNTQRINFDNLRAMYLNEANRNQSINAAGYATGKGVGDNQFVGATDVRRHDLGMLDEQHSANQQAMQGAALASLSTARAIAARRLYEAELEALKTSLRSERFTAHKQPGGLLNYAERRTGLQARMDQDFGDAKRRVASAKAGLARFYGYTGSLPLPATSGLGVYERYLIAVRRAISFVGSTRRRDQSVILVASLKSLVGEDVWNGTLASGKWQFVLEQSKIGLPNYYHLVRLRGMALSIVAGDDHDPNDVWRADIGLAQAGKAYRCHAPRVQRRHPLRPADLIGADLLHNLTPFGSWEIALSAPSVFGKPIQGIADLLVEFNVVAQTLREA